MCSYQNLMESDTFTSLVKLPGMISTNVLFVPVYTLRKVNVLAVEGRVWQYYFIKFTHEIN